MKLKKDLADSCVLLTITLLLLYTWAITGVGKILGGSVPEGFQQRFEGSIIATFPGIPTAFWMIAIGETIAAAVTLVSLVRLEFWTGKTECLRWALVGSLLLFVMLGFGLRLVGDHSGAASLFFYFGATLLMYRQLDRQRSR